MQQLTNQYLKEHKSQCCGCHACYNTCPAGAIQMQEDEEGFLYPQINEEKCIQCGRCAQVCRMMRKEQSPDGSIKAVYACMNRNLNERLASSSGGVFIRLADYVTARGGRVFGATFDQELRLHHESADNIEDCQKFMGSKYVQSIIGNAFTKAKRILDQGGLVLFSGTPCQIHGLKLFLGKPYENLLTVDVICHGVPSPMVFRRYFHELGEVSGSKVTSIQFRNKSSGWQNYSVVCGFENGNRTIISRHDSLYMKGFLSNLYLRPSCPLCVNKGDNYFSDITLGDYWGVENRDPDMDDDRGTSVVLIRTDKGRRLFDAIVPGMKIKPVDLEYVIKNNPSIKWRDQENKNREKFFAMYKKQTKPVYRIIDVCSWSRWIRFRNRVIRFFKK